MRGAETVNAEFDVGFNQTFESRWYRAEQVGRVVMLIVVACAALGLLGRGPFSHETKAAPGGAISVDYEPVARHGTSTMITVHVHDPVAPIRLLVDQHMIEPMGYQRATPVPDHTSVADDGTWLTFDQEPGQHDVLVRFDVMPTALGFVPMHVSDGTDSVDWSMFVVP